MKEFGYFNYDMWLGVIQIFQDKNMRALGGNNDHSGKSEL